MRTIEIPAARTARKIGPLVLAFALLPTTAQALELEPCRLDGLSEEVLCTSHQVFEDREAGSGRTIDLNIAILPAFSRRPAPDPLFVLAGGPGQGATELAPLAARVFRKLRARRDLVLVDLRGTGASNPLNCENDQSLLDSLTSETLSSETLAADPLAGFDAEDCLANLDADVRLYTTDLAIDDLDEVRAHLGYDQINLWGGSYGTRAAMVYLQRHGAHVRSLVLDGLAPHAIKLPLYYARDGQRALDLVLRDCAADDACAAAFPDLAGTLASLLERLAIEPAQATLRHPRSGESIDITVTAEAFAGHLRNFLYGPRHASLVPWIVHRAAAGDLGPFVAAIQESALGALDTMSLGLTLSVLCSEDLPRITQAEIEPATQHTFLGSLALEQWQSLCESWPRGRAPEAGLTTSDVPALLLSGDLDPVTPPSWGELALESFTNGRHVVVPGAAHNTMGSRCVQRLMAEFLETGDAHALDASCVQNIERPRFVVGLAGTAP